MKLLLEMVTSSVHLLKASNLMYVSYILSANFNHHRNGRPDAVVFFRSSLLDLFNGISCRRPVLEFIVAVHYADDQRMTATVRSFVVGIYSAHVDVS